jgi:MoaA/NifB/PqqE/SkfB family radical SAM enzyme
VRPRRTLQIHPSLRCNLACRHCYSFSGPTEHTALPQELIQQLIDDAPDEGYDALAVSGGEPLLWHGLRDTLARAKSRDMVTALTSNGIPLTTGRLTALASVLDLIAISLDGVPKSHDRMRGKQGAFAAMAERLPALRASGIPFGFLFTLTDKNLDELAWVAQFALDTGAALLQIHPLEEVGRAVHMLPGQRPSEIVANGAYLAYLRLQEQVGERLRLQLDLAHRAVLRQEPWRAHAGTEASGKCLADLVQQLIVESDGTVVPMQHGFPRSHALGSLFEAPLPVLAERWRADGFKRYQAHCAAVASEAISDLDALPAFNWHEMVVARA